MPQKKDRFTNQHYDLDPRSLTIIEQARAAMQSVRSPETSRIIPPPVIIPAPKTSAIATPSLCTPTTSYAVLAILRFQTLPEEGIVVIKDYEKPTLGFPFGGVETGEHSLYLDRDHIKACKREVLEEVFGADLEALLNQIIEKRASEFGVTRSDPGFNRKNLKEALGLDIDGFMDKLIEEKAIEFELSLSKENLIGAIPKSIDHTVYVYASVLPDSCYSKLKPGKEQQVVLVVNPSKIDQYIGKEIFLPAHAKGWEMFKQCFHK